MQQDKSNERIVQKGTFLYDGEVVCDVRIVFSRIRWGTGDYEDALEIGEGQTRDTYYVWYGSTTDRGVFNAGGGGFDTLDEATRHVEATVAGISWNNPTTV